MKDNASGRSPSRRYGVRTAAAAALLVSVSALATPAFAQAEQPVAADPPATATAQASAGVQQGDIIVTATRQSQTAQRVPIALTAVGSKQLAKEGITSATQLGLVSPSLYVLSSLSEGSPRVTIRGLTGTDYLPSGSPTIATYVDDVYQAFQFGVTSALFDLQRVEILRGPQGTTFGRNTTGGAVAYFSQTPTNKPEGYVSARLAGGDQSQRFLEAAVNVPLVNETLALRVSGRFDSKGGWIYDSANDRKRGGGDGQNGRVQLRWTPSSDTVVNLTGFAARWRGDASNTLAEFPPAPVDPHRTALSAYDLYDNFDNRGATLRVEQKLGGFNLTAISHYRKTDYASKLDQDSIPADIFVFMSTAKATQYGQEIRLASDATKRLSGIAGVYYERDKVGEVANEAAVIDANFNNLARYRTTTDSYAAFGNLTFKLTDTLSVIGGARKTIETRKTHGTKFYFLDQAAIDWTEGNIVFDGAPPVTPFRTIDYRDRIKSKPFTWDATVNFSPAKDLLMFARFSKGFRSGGFNPAQTATIPADLPPAGNELGSVPPPYLGETIKSYEGGIKATVWNNMLRINAGVYHYDYSDQQITQYLLVGTLPVAYTTNAGRSKVDGGELELNLIPDSHWSLRGSVSYTDGKYTRYVVPDLNLDFSGNRLAQAPKWTGNASISYKTPLAGEYDVRATTIWSYRNSIFFDAANSEDFRDGPLARGTVRLGLENRSGSGLSVAAYVDNVTDQNRLASGFQFAPGYNLKYFEPGRSYGLDLTYRW